MQRIRSQSGWVLGGSGFLGRALVESAQDAGLRVSSVSRHPQRSSANPIRLDLDSPQDELERTLEAECPDWLVNCAALAAAADCEREPELAKRLNAALPARLGQICQALGIRLLHLSTDNVFDGETPRPTGYIEEDTARPLSVYGTTKREGELALLAQNPDALIVRLPLLYGDSRGTGAGASDSLLAAIARGARPRLFTDEFRTPLDVQQAARALLEWIPSSLNGLLHLAGPQRLTRFELGERIVAAAGLALTSIEAARQTDVPCVPPRPRDLTLDGSRALASLSFCPTNPWDDPGNSLQGGSTP